MLVLTTAIAAVQPVSCATTESRVGAGIQASRTACSATARVLLQRTIDSCSCTGGFEVLRDEFVIGLLEVPATIL